MGKNRADLGFKNKDLGRTKAPMNRGFRVLKSCWLVCKEHAGVFVRHCPERYAALFTEFDHFTIIVRSCGGEEHPHPSIEKVFDRIVEGEIAVANRDRPFDLVIVTLCAVDREFRSIDPSLLTNTVADQFPVVHQSDGVRVACCADGPSEQKVVDLFWGCCWAMLHQLFVIDR